MKNTTRKITLLFAVIIMAMLCIAIGMTASAETWGDYEYAILDDETIEITAYNGETETNITIPNEINGIAVTSIGDCAFYGKTHIAEIEIPNTVTNIGYQSFRNCENLNNISLSNNLTSLDRYAFDGTIFYDTGSWIGDCYVISGCVTEVISYKDGNIRNISIPAEAKVFAEGVFYIYDYPVIESVFVDDKNPYCTSDEYGVLYNKNKTNLIYFPDNLRIDNYIIPDTVENVSEILNYHLKTVTFPKNIDKIDTFICPSIEEVYVYGVDMIIADESGLCYLDINQDMWRECSGEFFSLCDTYINEFERNELTTEEENQLQNKLEILVEKFIEYDFVPCGTIHCHSGSTAEAYAIENGIDYILTHFFEGDWTYDYDNMIRYRKCIHCDELETESLEATESGDVEIIEPADPDTDFVVDEVEKASDNYIIIEEALSNGVAGDFEIIKAFDITMTGKDGVHVQPDGTVKVKLPLDWSKDGIYKVYRVNDDGTLTDMQAYRQGSHMVFDTDHFSIYVIVDESEKTEETDTDFFSKIIDWFKSLIDIILSIFKK